MTPAERPPPPPPTRPPGASRYGWFVGVLVVLILAYILVNTLRTNGPGAQGPRPAHRLHPFAAPLVGSGIEGDVNLASHPDSGGAGRHVACAEAQPGVVTSCDLATSPSVVGFLFTRGAHCDGEFDAMQRLFERFPLVRFLGVVIGESEQDALRTVQAGRWVFPIAYDRDKAMSVAFGISGCPAVVLSYPGGVVRETLLGGDRAVRGLDERVLALIRASRRRHRALG